MTKADFCKNCAVCVEKHRFHMIDGFAFFSEIASRLKRLQYNWSYFDYFNKLIEDR